jgi:hypothetical protein
MVSKRDLIARANHTDQRDGVFLRKRVHKTHFNTANDGRFSVQTWANRLAWDVMLVLMMYLY